MRSVDIQNLTILSRYCCPMALSNIVSLKNISRNHVYSEKYLLNIWNRNILLCSLNLFPDI